MEKNQPALWEELSKEKKADDQILSAARYTGRNFTLYYQSDHCKIHATIGFLLVFRIKLIITKHLTKKTSCTGYFSLQEQGTHKPSVGSSSLLSGTNRKAAS
jgi:hypothetical protein